MTCLQASSHTISRRPVPAGYLLLVCLLLLTTACDQAQDEEYAGFLERRNALAEQVFSQCERHSRTLMAGLVAEAWCFTYEVPENHDAADSSLISLKVMVVPAIVATPQADPLVILVGGPGESATEAGVTLVPAFAKVRENRDIVLVDQRGTGPDSSLDCELEDDSLAFETSLDIILERQASLISSCLQELEAQAQFYTTDMAVRDLESIRQYLGYEKFNLWGGSYGTRVALEYLRAYPDSVRTAILDGVAPVGLLPLEPLADAASALDNILLLCTEEDSCRNAFPSLPADADELFASIDTPVEYRLPDFISGQPSNITISRDLLQSFFYTLLYSREASRLIPLISSEMQAGNFDMLAGISGELDENINTAMYLSVTCSEDMALYDPARYEEILQNNSAMASDLLVIPRVEACKQWPSRAMPPAFFEALESDVPVLLLSGSMDPVTPPRWAEQVQAGLTRSTHIVAKGIGHISTRYGCVSKLIAEFLDHTDPARLDNACIDDLQPRPFFTTRGGLQQPDD